MCRWRDQIEPQSSISRCWHINNAKLILIDVNNKKIMYPKIYIRVDIDTRDKQRWNIIFLLYLRAKHHPHLHEQWVEVKIWEIKSIKSQSKYVILDLGQKNDHMNIFYTHYMKHIFFLQSVEGVPKCEPKAVPTFSLNISKMLGDVLWRGMSLHKDIKRVKLEES